MIISGHGELDLGDDVVDLQTGDAATFQGSIPHRPRDPGRSPLTAISAITPIVLKSRVQP